MNLDTAVEVAIRERRSVWIALQINDMGEQQHIEYFMGLGEVWADAVISAAIVLGMRFPHNEQPTPS